MSKPKKKTKRVKLGTVGYIPPDAGFPWAFKSNLDSYKTRYPLYLFSNSREFGDFPVIPNPVNEVRNHNLPLSANNYVWLTAIDIALERGLDYFIYLEEDCRIMGRHWDAWMFDQFFDNEKALVGGTPSIWNIGICGAESAKKALRFVNKTLNMTGRPPLLWAAGGPRRTERGHPPMPEAYGPWLYPNGALGIYHTETVDAIFNGRKIDKARYALGLGAWDVVVGKALWNQFKMGAYDRFAIIPSQYSGYQNFHYQLAERKQLLTSKKVVGVHQIKENWIP